MRARFAGLFGEELAERLQFRTINGLSSSIIAYYARRYGREPFQLLDDPGRQSAILMDIYRRQNEEFASESTVKTLQTAITAIKNGMLTDEEIKRLEPEGIKIAPVYEAYCRTLKDGNLMDYDDQMVYARQILLRCPDVLDYWQKRFSYLCVDEAQDTSRIQHEIVRLLAQRERNLFMAVEFRPCERPEFREVEFIPLALIPKRGQQFSCKREMTDLRSAAADVKNAVGQLFPADFAGKIVGRQPDPGTGKILSPVFVGVAKGGFGRDEIFPAVPQNIAGIDAFHEWESTGNLRYR